MTRYSRQQLFPPIGPQGQAKLRASRVLLVGCGALGTHLAEFCARAGVAELTIVDRDFVEPSNLQRQSLFTEADAAQALPKAVAARAHLNAINSDIAVRAVVDDFNFRNARGLAAGADLILDGTDNFATRMLINDLSLSTRTPWVYAGCVAARAMCMPVLPGETACLRCMLEDLPAAGGESCDTDGVIMPAVLQAVAWASVVALKLLTGNRDALLRKLFTVDLWAGTRTVLDASRPRADCPACARGELDWLEGRRAARADVLCGRDSVQVQPDGAFDFAAARGQIGRAARITVENEYLLQTEFEGLSVTLYRSGRALVHGTDSIPRARTILARLLG